MTKEKLSKLLLELISLQDGITDINIKTNGGQRHKELIGDMVVKQYKRDEIRRKIIDAFEGVRAEERKACCAAICFYCDHEEEAGPATRNGDGEWVHEDAGKLCQADYLLEARWSQSAS